MLGAALCLVGGCSWLRREFRHAGDDDEYDYDYGDDDDHDHDDDDVDDTVRTTAYGDLLALVAACIYGLNDVLAEYFLKAGDDGAEYVGMLGLFGAVFSFCVQAPLLGEWDRARMLLGWDARRHRYRCRSFFLLDDHGGDYSVVALLRYHAVLFLTSAMAYLSLYDSTSLNLSLQTGPLWAVVLTMIQKSLTEEGNNGGWVGIPPAIFFTSLTLIVVGMFMYESNSGNERGRLHRGVAVAAVLQKMQG
ncbi:hypothetical protein ACHAW5_010650 [Stephanodiscus triporus]|uniref:Solute carrier family 40 protein n=1 Tax=Stephanodiscus triporus TaxID=2934178 RepID=A0ABD3NLS0_9STRA